MGRCCTEERGKLLESIVTESNIGADMGPLSHLFDFSGLKVCVCEMSPRRLFSTLNQSRLALNGQTIRTRKSESPRSAVPTHIAKLMRAL